MNHFWTSVDHAWVRLLEPRTSDQAMITMVEEEKRDGEGVIQNNKKKE